LNENGFHQPRLGKLGRGIKNLIKIETKPKNAGLGYTRTTANLGEY